MNGVILLPTLNRTGLLKNFITSYKETRAEIDVKILVDDADYEVNKAQYDAILNICPPTIDIMSTENKVSMADKTKHVWDTVKEYKWVGILNDDHYCVTDQWDKKVEFLIDGANMVSTNDGFWNFGFRVVGITAWSTKLLECVGFPIFPRGLQHLYIDDVWKAVGESTGCWYETMSVNIEHRHVFNGLMPEDDTFRRVNNQQAYKADLDHFQKFMEEDFKAVCERVIELRKTHIQENKFV